MDKPIDIVSIGGGNGQGQVAKSLVIAAPNIPGLRATFVTAATDDGYTSTGQLRKKGNRAGYYGDVTRVLGALSSALGGRDWLSGTFATRFENGIAGGQPFGDLLASLFGGTFRERGMKGPYRPQAVESIRAILNIESIDNEMAQELLTEALEYPLEEDDFSQHSFRNLFLFTLEQVAVRRGLALSCALEAIHIAYGILDEYRVLPVTWESGFLKAKTKSGKPIEGQFHIDFRDRDPFFERFDEIKELWIDPPVAPSKEVIQAILEADAIIIACGSLMGNVVAPFVIPAMKDALRQRTERGIKERMLVPVVYVMNLMTKVGETQFDEAYTAADIVELVTAAIGQRPNCVIYDTTDIPWEIRRQHLPEQKIKLGGLKKYATSSRYERPSLMKEKVAMVALDGDADLPPKIVHDPEKLARVFAKIFSESLVGTLS